MAHKETPAENWNKVTILTSLTDLVFNTLIIWGTNEKVVSKAAKKPTIDQVIFFSR